MLSFAGPRLSVRETFSCQISGGDKYVARDSRLNLFVNTKVPVENPSSFIFVLRF